jgi:hypothetical protein
MPSYGNFRNSFKRNAEGEDLFKNPKQSMKESDIIGAKRDNLIDWITFYRRNVHRFVEHYFGIQLYPYQILWMYEMGVCDSYVAICSRAVGKSWLIAVYACARAVLYPNSEIVIVSSTKEQAGIIVGDKIASLRVNYPNLAREISNVVTNMNKWQVDFHNGSIIKVVASRDSSRGKRSTLTLYEEFRLISKEVLDSVIRPFAYIRQTPYLKNPIYECTKEEPKEIFISSAYHKGLWWFEETKKNIKAMLKGDNSGFIALDYLVAIRHNIKTQRQVKNEISKMNEITALEEYLNIPWSESASSYFRLKMFTGARKIKKAFYQQRSDTFNIKKNPYGITKTDGEIRIVSCDVAQKAGSQNDLSVSTCLRLLPTQKGYIRECVNMQSFSGVDSITQSLRIKQLFYDFEADYIVLDVGAGGGGLPMYDQLGQITRDPERGIEYSPMTIMAHSSIDKDVYDELSRRTLGLNARPVIYPISATAKLNSMMAISLRDSLQKKLWEFLVDESTAEDWLIRSSWSKEFLDHEDSSARSFFLIPYLETSLFINEAINLSVSFINNNSLKLIESSGNRKDRFTSLNYGGWLCSLLDLELLKLTETDDDFDFVSRLIQTT